VIAVSEKHAGKESDLLPTMTPVMSHVGLPFLG
jgi:hypothetical protein